MPITYFKLGRQGQLLFNASCTSFRDFILFWSSPTWTTDLFLQNWPTWDYSVHQKDLLQFRRAIPEVAIYSKVCNAAEVCWDWTRQGLNEESSPGILKVSKRVAHTPCVPHSVWRGLKKMLNMFSLREVITIIWWLFIRELFIKEISRRQFLGNKHRQVNVLKWRQWRPSSGASKHYEPPFNTSTQENSVAGTIFS